MCEEELMGKITVIPNGDIESAEFDNVKSFELSVPDRKFVVEDDDGKFGFSLDNIFKIKGCSEFNGEKMNKEEIRKVDALGGRLKEKAIDQGLSGLVLVETEIKEDELPEYHLTDIDGSPTEFLKNRGK